MQGFLLALKSKTDLIVTDYNMDHGSGNYLLSRVKSTGSTKHVPVVIYTSTPLEKGLEHAIHRELIGRGAAAFIARPLDATSLVAPQAYRRSRLRLSGGPSFAPRPQLPVT
jgi:response regulator RpfG family c-di-GMP phosphodiesterase